MQLENWASKLLTGVGAVQLTTKLLARDGHCQLWAHACASIDKLEFQHLVGICYCVMCIQFNSTNVCKCPSTFCVKSPWGYHMSPANTFPLITSQGIYQVAIGSKKKDFQNQSRCSRASLTEARNGKRTESSIVRRIVNHQEQDGRRRQNGSRVRKVLQIKSSCGSLFESNQSKTEGLKRQSSCRDA